LKSIQRKHEIKRKYHEKLEYYFCVAGIF